MTMQRALALGATLAIAALLVRFAIRRPLELARQEVQPPEIIANTERSDRANPPETADRNVGSTPPSSPDAGKPGVRSVRQPPSLVQETLDRSAEVDPCAEVFALHEADDRLAESDRHFREALKELVVTQDWNETPLPEVVSLLQEVTQLNIMIDRHSIEFPEDVTLTWTVENKKLGDLLDELCDRTRLGWYVDEGVVVLSMPAVSADRRARAAEELGAATERLSRERQLFEQTVRIQGTQLPIRTLAELLSRSLALPCHVEQLEYDDPPCFDLGPEERTAMDVVQMLKRHGVTVAYHDGMLWFLPRMARSR